VLVGNPPSGGALLINFDMARCSDGKDVSFVIHNHFGYTIISEYKIIPIGVNQPIENPHILVRIA